MLDLPSEKAIPNMRSTFTRVRVRCAVSRCVVGRAGVGSGRRKIARSMIATKKAMMVWGGGRITGGMQYVRK